MAKLAAKFEYQNQLNEGLELERTDQNGYVVVGSAGTDGMVQSRSKGDQCLRRIEVHTGNYSRRL
jgi:hypothetical protein